MSNIEKMNYSIARPYRLTGMTLNEGAAALADTTIQRITYASFDRPLTISGNGYTATLTYTDDYSRTTMTIRSPLLKDPFFKRTYIGNYEADSYGSQRKNIERYYIGGDAYSAPAVYVRVNSGQWKLHYIYRDYQGSVTDITDASGTVVHRMRYSPWGKLLHTDGTPYTRSEELSTDYDRLLFLGRGYTGHEYLPWFGLVNMNARLYDPAIGRFLSPDPYVQMPDFSQNFNRYSYCLNNPLKFTDPSGEFFFSFLIPGLGTFIDAACWGAVIGGATYTASVAMSSGGFSNWNWGQFAKSMGFGAASGILTAGIGQAFGAVGSNGIIGEAYRALSHGAANGMITRIQGDNFGTGFVSGGLSSLAGSAFMIYAPAQIAANIIGNYAFSGLVGGVSAAVTGGDFWQGVTIGLMTAGLNHLQQGINSRLSLAYDGAKLSVVDKDGSVIYSTSATSGKGEHMNNPASQHIENLGPIPEGEYSYKNNKWQTMTRIQQIKRLILGGDWGTHNVPLEVVRNNSARSGFYLHGGLFKGSAGCIDVGANIGKIYSLTRLQKITYVYVNY